MCFFFEFSLKIFHVEDVIEATGYVLEKDSEYCQKFLEEEEEVTISVTGKGGSTTKHQVKQAFLILSWKFGGVLLFNHFGSFELNVIGL